MESALDELAQQVGERLRQCGATLSSAESVTGGALGATLASVAGASDYYLGGVVAYSARMKEELLGVAPELLRQHGPVSRAVAAAMAQRMRLVSRADYSLSVTGNAGPTADVGGRPVGVVYVGLCSCEAEQVVEHLFAGDRRSVQCAAVRAALLVLLDHLSMGLRESL